MSSNTKMIRVWTELDINKIKDHILFIDDHYGVCGKCKQTGLKYMEDQSCKGCGAKFHFLATKLASPADIGKILSRIKSEKLDLQLIDRSDFERSSSNEALNNLFK